jgi:hypothetical protein
MLTLRKMFSRSLVASAARQDGNDGLDGLAVEGLGLFEAGRGEAADDFRDFSDAGLRVAGVFAFGREGEVEVGAGLETRALFEHGAEVFIGGAGVGGGFEHDELAAAEMGGEGFAGLDDVRDVGFAILVERSGHADDGGFNGAPAGEIGGGGEAAGGDLFGDGFRGDVMDVGAAGVEGFDLVGVDVEAQDGDA